MNLETVTNTLLDELQIVLNGSLSNLEAGQVEDLVSNVIKNISDHLSNLNELSTIHNSYERIISINVINKLFNEITPLLIIYKIEYDNNIDAMLAGIKQQHTKFLDFIFNEKDDCLYAEKLSMFIALTTNNNVRVMCLDLQNQVIRDDIDFQLNKLYNFSSNTRSINDTTKQAIKNFIDKLERTKEERRKDPLIARLYLDPNRDKATASAQVRKSICSDGPTLADVQACSKLMNDISDTDGLSLEELDLVMQQSKDKSQLIAQAEQMQQRDLNMLININKIVTDLYELS